MESGLPGNCVYTVRQTRDGFLWIGTRDGLVRFDGLNFQLYSGREAPQLESNQIRALCEDRDGSLWIGTDTGGLVRYKDGEFTRFSDRQTISKISSIEEDRWGNIWIGSFTGGLTRLENGTFTTYTTAEGLPGNQVVSIYKDTGGDLWVTTASGIVNMREPGVFQVYVSPEELPYYITASLYNLEAGDFWIGTGANGLFRGKGHQYKNYGSASGLPHPIVTYLYQDRQDTLWIGTDGGGLTRLSHGEMSTLAGGRELDCGSVSTIYEDREGSLWVGTLDCGLYQLRDTNFITYTTHDGLLHDSANCSYSDLSGDLWVGTNDGLNMLTLKEGEAGKTATFSTIGAKRLNAPVTSILEKSPGNYLIGTWEGLYFLKEGRSSNLTRQNGLSDNRVKCLCMDKQGNTWIGTQNGLNRLSRDKTINIYTTEHGLPGNIVNFIYQSRNGVLLAGTANGLVSFKNGEIVPFSPIAGLEKFHFRCIYEEPGGVLWFGTHSGLIRSDGEKSTLYNLSSGLTGNYIYTILEDQNGYLWLGGRNGVSRVRKKELDEFAEGKITRIHPHSYNEKDGMLSRWCTGPAGETPDGRFWFPTSRGVASIDPNKSVVNTVSPPLMIGKIIVDGEQVQVKPFKDSILEINPGIKRLEFYYTAVSFINPADIRFKLLLEGYDRNWVDMGASRSTTYTGLSPGNYTFKLMARNPPGVWEEKGISLSLYLKPYYYQTTWFYIFAVIFILLMVVFFHKLRVRRLKVRQRELKEMVESRTMQLAEQSEKLKEVDRVKSRFFANISHEFRTPLTLIIGPLEEKLAKCRDEEDKHQLNLMLRNSRRLLTLINQLLDLSKFDSGKMELKAVRQDIIPFLKGLLFSFDSMVRLRELALKFHAVEEEIHIYFDASKLENAILNLLINAIKFTPPGGEITLSLKTARKPYPGYLDISVRDTGIGIPAGELGHIFDRFHQGEHNHRGTGIGLALAKEMVTLHHGEITARSQKGKGSEFIIRLPLGNKHLKTDEMSQLPPGQPEPVNKQETILPEPVSKVEAVKSESKKGDNRDIILVVEDNADVRDYIRGPLLAGYRVVEAVDGEEGVQKAKEIIPDLIISDIMMPGIDGTQLCRELKSHIDTSHIPIILLTARAGEEHVVEGLETGADDYITKPFNTKILLARIENLIRQRLRLQESMRQRMSLQPVTVSLSKVDEEFVKELQEAIEKNISDSQLNVKKLGEILYMSHTSLYRKIQALTGESPVEFIRSYRLKRAAEMIRSGSGSVTEISEEVGFSSPAYFSRRFKEKFNQSPSEYKSAKI